MESIKIEVIGNIARVTKKPGRITSGTVGLPVEFSFDSQWDGLSKTAVFEGGDVQKVVDSLEYETVVPWEVLANPGPWLSIGVYGVNADGSAAIPTIWANVGPIHVGVNTDGDPAVDPKLPVWQKVLNAIGNLLGLTTNDKSNLVGAINEVHNIALAGGIETDTTLTKKGKAAEAKATGDAIASAKHEAINLADSHINSRANPHNVTIEQIGAASAKYVEATFIPSGEDMDRLTTPGRYACKTDEIAKTLLGCPVDGPFTMDVRYANGVGPRVGQELRPEGKGARLYRQFVGYSEILSDEAKKLYDKVQKVRPDEFVYVEGGDYGDTGDKVDIYSGGEDISWYNESASSFYLDTADKLYGLATLVNSGKNFAGKTVKLTKDMVINEGVASAWNAETTGLYVWTPIGSGTSKCFSGTFDGQGHYISGLYNGSKHDNGLFGFTTNATIQNLAVINSYFGTTTTNGQFLSGLVARALGSTLKDLYSDAILVSKLGEWHTGGIAGCVKTGKVDSCVFAGAIHSAPGTGKSNKYVGGIMGGPDGDSFSAQITNCLFAGYINTNDTFVGGIAGLLGPGSVVDGCISVGKIERTGSANNVGAILGYLSGTGNQAITNCYYSAELGLDLYCDGDAGSVVETTGSKVLPTQCVRNSMMPGKWVKVYDSENMPTPVVISEENDPDGKALEEKLNTMLSEMEWCETRQIAFSNYPVLSGARYNGTLFKGPEGYAVLTGESYDGSKVTKQLYNGVWYPYIRVEGLNARVVRVSGNGGYVRFRLQANLLVFGAPSNADQKPAVCAFYSYAPDRPVTFSLIAGNANLAFNTHTDNGYYAKITNSAGGEAVLYFIGSATPEFF